MDNRRHTDENKGSGGLAASGRASSLDVMQFLILLAKRKKTIFGICLAFTALGAAYSFALPNVYLATASLLPPQQSQSGAAALLSQLGGMAGVAGGAAGLKSPNDLYIGMLKSRTIADHLITEFTLQKAYDLDGLEKTRAALAKKTAISSGRDGLITIEVEDENRERTASLANAYINELIKLTRVLAVTEAGQRRAFYETQFIHAKNDLAAAEMALKTALDRRGVISVDTETRAIVENVARLRAQISAQEIELNAMRAFVTSEHPEYMRAQERLTSLRGELAKLENGRAGAMPESSGPTQGGLENIKVLRDVKYYQMLYEILAKQYEIARLDEAKDGAVIQVLDTAVVPEQKYKPRRTVIILLSAFAGVIASITWALLGDSLERTSSRRANQWAELKSYLRK